MLFLSHWIIQTSGLAQLDSQWIRLSTDSYIYRCTTVSKTIVLNPKLHTNRMDTIYIFTQLSSVCLNLSFIILAVTVFARWITSTVGIWMTWICQPQSLSVQTFKPRNLNTHTVSPWSYKDSCLYNTNSMISHCWLYYIACLAYLYIRKLFRSDKSVIIRCSHDLQWFIRLEYKQLAVITPWKHTNTNIRHLSSI